MLFVRPALLPIAPIIVALSLALAGPARAEAQPRPNVLVILADDLGNADVGFQGCRDIPTPNLDALAAHGVRCTSGYVTHPFCSPTRAGLLSGRYQQHFGHENNPTFLPDDPTVGLPATETTLPQVLVGAGYETGCIGKWHLGAHPVFHPNRRGFQYFFGFLGGGHVYFPNAKSNPEYGAPLERNGTPEPFSGYLTDMLGDDAAAFIAKKHDKPWLLYLAFNAPHTPLQVTEDRMQRVKHIDDERRRGYAGLVVGLDDAVGKTLAALRASGQEQNTLVFFLSDNGGPASVTHARNTPLAGEKGLLYEGGTRVPFVVSWPGVLPQGATYEQPLSSLDIFATSAALAGATVPAEHHLDGVDIVPYLKGEKTGAPHERLYWRTGGGKSFAAREGKYKYLQRGPQEYLYDLASDIGETTDLSGQHPDVFKHLQESCQQWNKLNIPPLFESPAAGRKAKGNAPAVTVQ